MGNDEIFERIVQFAEEEFGLRARDGRVDRDVKLYEDMKLYGDDAVEFLIEFGKKFNVDVSKFETDKFFKGEGYDLWSAIKELYDPEKYPIYPKRPLTLGDLEQAAINGKLI